MGKKGKKAQAGKAKKLTPKEIGKRLDALVKKLEEELKGADLFAPPPPMDDCPICLVPLSRGATTATSTFQACCGKIICFGCYKANEIIVENQSEIAHTCPFCRAPETTGEQYFLQLETRAQKHPDACLALGEAYIKGHYGNSKDELKALDCWIRAAELGDATSCAAISRRYDTAESILPMNKKRSVLFARLGALRGDLWGRYNIGIAEDEDGNHEIAIRHWKIAAECGNQLSLDHLKDIFNTGGPGKEFISKGDMDKIYRLCHEAQEEVRSEEREKYVAESGTM